MRKNIILSVLFCLFLSVPLPRLFSQEDSTYEELQQFVTELNNQSVMQSEQQIRLEIQQLLLETNSDLSKLTTNNYATQLNELKNLTSSSELNSMKLSDLLRTIQNGVRLIQQISTEQQQLSMSYSTQQLERVNSMKNISEKFNQCLTLMERIVESTNENIGVIETEMGNMQANIDVLKAELGILNVQINALEYQQKALEKRLVNNTIAAEITIPILCGISAASALFIQDDVTKKACLYTTAGAFLTCELLFNSGHFLFKWF